MCNRLITTPEGHTIACRKCEACVQARRNDWIARAVAEQATSTETIAIELTYRNNPDGTLPDGAKTFRYDDVRDFLRNLREAYFRRYGARGEIRFVVAGERGTQKKRVHWHMVLFADRPISTLGEWTTLRGRELEKMPMEKMAIWSLWPHGHVRCKEPHQGGIGYVLKYITKEAWSSLQAKGTMREAKAQESISSYFRMSKKPPLGWRYLKKICDEYEARLVVPTSLNVRVPGLGGHWYPRGKLREYFLDRLYGVNERSKELLGRPCPQWSTLEAWAVSQKIENDWEGLTYGPQTTEEPELFDGEYKPAPEWLLDYFRERYAVRDDLRARADEARARASGCGTPFPCDRCFKSLGVEETNELRAYIHGQNAEFKKAGHADFLGWYAEKGIVNPFCRQRSGALERAYARP